MEISTEVLHGDCLDIIKTMPDSKIDMVYLDPPFYTQRKHILAARSGNQSYSFEDRWLSMLEYASYMHERLSEIRRVLKQTGSVFFHCDRTASHIARLLLDDVFGSRNFQSEIIWSYKRWSNSARKLLPAHQTILFYSKGNDFKFNAIFTEYSPTTNLDQILQKRSRDSRNKSVYALDENGDVQYGGSKRGVPLSDVWEIPFLNPKAKERTGYPTQKPILLLERIVQISTDEGDTVLDPFCGSGTTLLAANILKRSAIGIDISEEAVKLTQERLAAPVKTESKLLKNGIDSYNTANGDALALLGEIPHTPVHRNSGIDAFLVETYQGSPIPVRVQRLGESLEIAVFSLYNAAKTKNIKRMILVAIEEQPALFPMDIPKEVKIVDSTALSINKLIQNMSIKA